MITLKEISPMFLPSLLPPTLHRWEPPLSSPCCAPIHPPCCAPVHPPCCASVLSMPCSCPLHAVLHTHQDQVYVSHLTTDPASFCYTPPKAMPSVSLQTHRWSFVGVTVTKWDLRQQKSTIPKVQNSEPVLGKQVPLGLGRLWCLSHLICGHFYVHVTFSHN